MYLQQIFRERRLDDPEVMALAFFLHAHGITQIHHGLVQAGFKTTTLGHLRVKLPELARQPIACAQADAMWEKLVATAVRVEAGQARRKAERGAVVERGGKGLFSRKTPGVEAS